MKKIVALVLVLVMVLSMSTVAFAAEKKEYSIDSIDLSGITSIVNASKTLLEKALKFATALKDSMKGIKALVTLLPVADTKVISGISDSVTEFYNNVKTLNTLVATIDKLGDLFGNLIPAFAK